MLFVPYLVADHNNILYVSRRVQNFTVIGWTDFKIRAL